MAIVITCPRCQNDLRVREEHAGRSVQCPRCAAPVAVPALPGEGGEEIPEVLPVRPTAGGDRQEPVVAKGARRPEAPPGDDECPDCGEPVPEEADRCPGCGAWLDDEDDLPARRHGFKPCPRCGSRGARRVSWTAWGSFYGPALFHHVRCPECGLGYNGRSGGSNLLPAVVFVTVPATLILLILAAVGYLIVTTAKL